ncbi:Endonuclease-reverse transcriptase [Operophtera brumata]|uniref:Endonuclease-reverse transcriptase n=1 Tax=Operophtera brumata TaxID=104452 RepID=A0A0L7KYR3_OPEBR|nr:Endonuclease-reverse transcriptase [Operophtera brumata]
MPRIAKRLPTQIKRHKWNWICHTLRMHIPKQALNWNPKGKVGKTWSEVKREFQDRTRWKVTVAALFPTIGH